MARRKLTSQMTAVDLAKVFAQHHGYYGAHGGWIYAPNGRPIAHGWHAFAGLLKDCGFIRVGAGVDWIRVHRGVRLPGVAPARKASAVAATNAPKLGPNPAYVRADQERRRSSAASPQDSRPRRQRTRAASRNAAIRDHQ